MKKQILPLLLIVFATTSYSQTFNSSTGIDTIVVSALSKTQIYSNALGFISSSFKDSRNVIEMKDQDLGEIAFNGNISKSYLEEVIKGGSQGKKVKKEIISKEVTLFFKCRIYAKDQKYKIILSGLEYDILKSVDIKFDLMSPGDKATQRNNEAAAAAIDLIKRIVFALNKKPESDF